MAKCGLFTIGAEPTNTLHTGVIGVFMVVSSTLSTSPFLLMKFCSMQVAFITLPQSSQGECLALDGTGATV